MKTVRTLSLGLALSVLAACSGASSVAPSATVPPLPSSSAPAPEATQPACQFAAVQGSARIYDFVAGRAQVSDYTKCSRFILYDDGRFGLEYGLRSIGTYPGTYAVAGETLDLTWNGWSVAGPWVSSATLIGDTLTVQYGLIMSLTDFEDATYGALR